MRRYAAERAGEIREACVQHNALDFIRSVDAIVTVRDELKRLDGVSDEINSELQRTGRDYTEAAHTVLALQVREGSLVELVIGQIEDPDLAERCFLAHGES